MANKRIIELNERTTINMGDFLMVDDATGSRKLAMSTLFNYLTYSSLMFVDTLPTTDIDPTVIYLVPHSGSTTQWDEYIYRDNQWQLIGTSTLDLTSIYQTKTDNNLQTNSKQIVGAINEVNSNLDVTTGTTSDQYVNYIKVGKLVIVTFNLRTATGSATPNWTEVATLPINVAEAFAAGASPSGKNPLVRVSGTKAYVMTYNTTNEAVSGQVVSYIV